MALSDPPGLLDRVELSDLTTFEMGGPARVAVAASESDLRLACRWAHDRGERVRILGGGSNLIVHERGVPQLVVRLKPQDSGPPGRFEASGRVQAWGGWDWDLLVQACVARGWTGVEALSGIPGRVGAAPIQNIGAYGQELSQVLESVRVYDLEADRFEEWTVDDLALGYRSSRLKSDASGRWVVTEVRLGLRPGAPPELRYRDLQERLDGRLAAEPVLALQQVRQTVLQVRAAKSMVWDASDPNRRSAGSFFVNPVVEVREADWAASRAPADAGAMPRHPADEPGRVKLSAAWLIQHAGYARGHTCGRVGLSSRHTLALINRGGARATELLRFAAEVRTKVRDRFGVALTMEPRVWGFERDDPLLEDAGVSPRGPVDGVGAPP